MPLNIIVKSGGGKVSNSELSETLARANDEAVVRDNHTYKERSRRIRKEAEKMNFGPGVRPRAVYDLKTYMNIEQANPGAMTDETFLKELRRDNPEMRLD
jgi:hypothetical protein